MSKIRVALEYLAVASAVWTSTTAVLNPLLRKIYGLQTPEDWIRMAERSPRLARAIAFVRAAGTDPAEGLRRLLG